MYYCIYNRTNQDRILPYGNTLRLIGLGPVGQFRHFNGGGRRTELLGIRNSGQHSGLVTYTAISTLDQGKFEHSQYHTLQC